MRAEWLCVALAACGGTTWKPPPAEGIASPPGSEAPPPPAASVPPASKRAQSGDRLELGPGNAAMLLGDGRWVVELRPPARRFVTVGVAGKDDGLVRFEVVAQRPFHRLRNETFSDDRRLPIFVSFESPAEPISVRVVIDAKSEVRLVLVSESVDDIAPRLLRDVKAGKAEPRPLVGLPFPIEPRAGYVMEAPHRYGFVRTDVATALRAAFRQTRIRYKRNLLAVGDASQWNGGRPGADLDKARHISHDGGRDVDVALPSREDGASRIVRRCEGVLVENQRLQCAPGTVKGLDAERLAYFLGLLIDGPTPNGRHVPDASKRRPFADVETIFTDQAYIDEIRKALPGLKAKNWIHEEAFGALGEDGLLRPSPWHTDHVHIRFRGENARPAELLRFEPSRSIPGGRTSSSKR